MGIGRLIFATGFLWIATAGAGQTPSVAPADEASIDRFLKALPEARTLDGGLAPDPDELARIAGLNPGREAEVETILTAHSGCMSSVTSTMTTKMLRGIARGLGQEKLQRMIAFYEGPDVARVDHLFGRIENGEDISPAEQAEADGLLARYPIEEMMDALDNLHLTIGKDQAFMEGLSACDRTKSESFEKASLILG